MKLIVLLLSISLVQVVFGFDSEEFSFEPISKTEVLITGYHGSDVSVDFPQTCVHEYSYLEQQSDLSYKTIKCKDIYSVVGISSRAFQYSPISHVVIPATYKIINQYAFDGCAALKSVVIPDSVTNIDSYAFSGCTALKSVVIPNSVANVDSYAFSGCTAIDAAEFPVEVARVFSLLSIKNATVTSRGSGYSIWLDSITNLVIKGEIPKCSSDNLEECRIIGNPSEIPNGAFCCCPKLKKITLPKTLKRIGTRAFERTSFNEIELPDGLVEISGSAFSGCAALTRINIPASVKKIGGREESEGVDSYRWAFGNCPLLKEVHITSLEAWCNIDFTYHYDNWWGNGYLVCLYCNPLENGASLYLNGRKLEEITIPSSITEVLPATFTGGDFKSVQFHDAVRSIGEDAFSDCNQLTYVHIPDTVTNIGAAAFASCDLLEQIRFPRQLDVLPDLILSGCANLETVVFPQNLICVGGNAFSYCESLKHIQFPRTVRVIGDAAFSCCNGLESIDLTGVEELGGYVFSDCASLRFVELPRELSYIDQGAFSWCTSITSVVINAEIDELPGEAFWGCERLKTVILPESSLYIDGCAFDECNSINEVYIRGEISYDEWPFWSAHITSFGFSDMSYLSGISDKSIVTNIEIYGAVGSVTRNDMNGFSNLTSMKLCEGMDEIGQSAFEGFDKLDKVEIPASLKSIGESVFRNCTALKDVSFGDSLEQIGDRMFEGCVSLRIVSLPMSVRKIGHSAFQSCSNLEEIVFAENTNLWVDENAFDSCTSLKNVDLRKVHTAFSASFANCIGLREVVIPTGFSAIGSGVFEGCTGVEKFSLAYQSSYEDGITNLFGDAATKHLIRPKNVESGFFPLGISTERVEELVVTEGTRAGSARLFTPPSAKKVVFPASLVDAKDLAVGGPQYTVAEANPMYMHDYNHSLRSKGGSKMLGWSNHSRWWYGGMPGEIGFFLDYVREIGDKAFQNCDKLEYLCFDWNVTKIGKGAFKGLTSLKSVSFGEKVMQIDDSAFEDCVNLESVNAFPVSLKKLGKRSFANCKKADHFYFWGKPPSTSGTNGLQNAFVGASPNTRGTGWYTYKNYTAWTNKVGKLGQWQGLDMFCMATNRVEYHFNWLLPQTKTSYDSMMADLENCSNVVSCELSPDVSNEALIAAELLGVSPTITVEGNTAYFNVDSSFRVEEFAIDSENKSATLTISIETENGIIDPSFTMVGIPDVQVAEDLNGEWRDLNLKDSFIVNCVSEKRVLLSTTVDLSSYRFFRAKVK